MKQRILTAVLALLVFLPFVIYGKWPLILIIYLIATVGLLELLHMRHISRFSVPSVLAVALLWILLASFEGDFFPGFAKTETIMLFVLVFLVYTVLVKNTFTFDHAGFVLLSVVYVGMGFFYMLETRTAGLLYLIFVFVIVWATDTVAYFFGRAFGKHKLWPAISPKKTVEGALGGIALACAAAFVFQLVSPIDLPMYTIIGAAILASVAGQMGDLVESAFKRYFGVKDSGNILPGHGGVLDRFDSMLFVFPLLHLVGFIP